MALPTFYKHMDTVLRPLGFVRRRSIWNRRCGPFVDVVESHTSNLSHTRSVGVGVFLPDVYAKVWNESGPAFPDSPHCIVSSDLGALIDGKSMSWRGGEASGYGDIAWLVAQHAVPFLDRMHSFEALAEALSAHAQPRKYSYPLPALYLAILRSELGDTTGARAILDALDEETCGGWSVRAAQVKARLGLA